MLLLISAAILWIILVIACSFVLVARGRRLPHPHHVSTKDLLYVLPVVALVAWILYNLATSLLAGRINLPVRGSDSYFDMTHSPAIFCSIFSIEFLLTAVVSILLLAPTLLVLRSARHEA